MAPKGLTILVAEDEQSLRSIFAAWFNDQGYHTLTAEHGQEALDLMAVHKVDLVVSDVRMPVVDGVALARSVRATGRYVPRIIFVSAFADMTRREAAALGVEAFLPKPIRRLDLIATAARVLQDRAERWASRPGEAPQHIVAERYDSVATALRQKQIAFGRGGLCLRVSTKARPDQPVGLDLHFAADGCKLEGEGLVRWKEPVSRQIGIEINYLAPGCLAAALALFEAHAVNSYIPADCRAPRAA